MAKKHAPKKATKHAAKKAAPAAEVPMKTYAEQPAAPAPVSYPPLQATPAPGQPVYPTPTGQGYSYPPQQPGYPQGAQPQRQPYNGGGGTQGQGEFTRITGLFASKTKMGSSSAVLKENELGLLRQIAATATTGDKLGVSLDRNGRPFLWFMKVR